MSTFKDLVIQEADKSLRARLPDYNWFVQNTNWSGVAQASNALTVYGRDKVLLSNYKNYLDNKLSNVILSGRSITSNSDYNATINDMISSITYAQEIYKLVAFSSMDTSPGGALRASVAIVLARKYDASHLGSVVYKAIYDVTAKNAHVWHNQLGHLQKAQGWAIYKALSDFKKNADHLLSYMYVDGTNTSIINVEKSF
jgi:hypothetical protein